LNLSGSLISVHVYHIQIHDDEIDVLVGEVLVVGFEEFDHPVAVRLLQEVD
jgi:hypothetical protein